MTDAPTLSEECYRSYLEALLAGDRHRCANLLQDQIEQGLLLKTVYIDLMQRAMYEVGTLWEKNLVSVATEHLASAITEVLLTLVYTKIVRQSHRDRRAVIACVPNEYHQIGPRMVADFFEMNGWHSFSLGANTSTAGLIDFIRKRDPDVVGLSMSLLFNRPRFDDMIEAVSTEFPQMEILIGGRAFHGEGAGQQAREDLLQRYPQAKYFASLHDLESYLTRV